MAVFILLETPKLISRKMCVAEKSWNNHTVQSFFTISADFLQSKLISRKIEFYRSPKNAFVLIFGHRIFDLDTFQPSKTAKILEKSNSRASECVKIAVFECLKSLKLISLKIWVTKKSWNFHTVTNSVCYFTEAHLPVLSNYISKI